MSICVVKRSLIATVKHGINVSRINISIHDYFLIIEYQGRPKPLFYGALKVLFPVDFGRKCTRVGLKTLNLL
jgi:hypothetical protein